MLLIINSIIILKTLAYTKKQKERLMLKKDTSNPYNSVTAISNDNMTTTHKIIYIGKEQTQENTTDVKEG